MEAYQRKTQICKTEAVVETLFHEAAGDIAVPLPGGPTDADMLLFSDRQDPVLLQPFSSQLSPNPQQAGRSCPESPAIFMEGKAQPAIKPLSLSLLGVGTEEFREGKHAPFERL